MEKKLVIDCFSERIKIHLFAITYLPFICLVWRLSYLHHGAIGTHLPAMQNSLRRAQPRGGFTPVPIQVITRLYGEFYQGWVSSLSSQSENKVA